jgi:flagellar biosynthesis protein FlhF
MKIKRFVAKDMRTALAQIKEVLGVDAVIMSNKKIPEGVELMAAVDYNQAIPNSQCQDKLGSVVQTQPQSNNQREVSNDRVSIGQQSSRLADPVTEKNNQTSLQKEPSDSLSALLNRQVQQPIQLSESVTNNLPESSIEQQLKNFTDRLSNSQVEQQGDNVLMNDTLTQHVDFNDDITANQLTQSGQLGQSNKVSSTAVEANNVTSANFEKMQAEMASIRSLLEYQVSGLMWQDLAQKAPQRAVLVNRLLKLGLTDQIADQIAGYVNQQASDEKAWEQAKQCITKQINTTQNDIINRGGVVALVGPTGVGKTTTVAKLAAGFAKIHGRDSVALISTDTFRISGFDQLATYGKIIGCQVDIAKDNNALNSLLQQLSDKKLILIDTAGMGQRDIRLAEQLTSLVSNARVRIRSYLVLAANAQQGVMQENVDRFKRVPLSGCIYTKLDESISIGEIITTSIQNGLPIGYLTDGQRVPEDIKVANAEKLVTLADKMAMMSVNNNVNTLRSMPTTSTVSM